VHDTAAAVEFIRRQLEIFRAQADAIARGDLIAARTAGDQLRRSLPGLVQIVELSRNGGGFNNAEKEIIDQTIAEIKSLHASANSCLTAKRDKLGDLLCEFRRGRQLIIGYRSGALPGGKLFEMIG
jgi:hypothetical protein